jgi:calcium/calmodulin-dependent protein kinase (CaM kinase) II
MDKVSKELLELTQKLLESIADGDYDTYQTICHTSLTAFEPEAKGHLVEGLAFHKYYFDMGEVSIIPH